MKKLITTTVLLICIFVHSSCQNEEPKNQFDCMLAFQKAASIGDFEEVERLTNSLTNDPVKLLSDYKKPSLELIEETQDGAFGVKVRDNITLFYMKLRDDNFMVKDTFVIGVMQQPNNTYRISHFSKPSR